MSTTISGNLTRDPELRYSSSGVAVASFGVAVTRKFKRGDVWEESVSFLNVVAWRDLAENVAASLRKGDRVVVTGRLEQRSWETDSGDKRSVIEIQAEDVGASLMWATTEISRTERAGKGQREQKHAPPAVPANPEDEEPF